MKITRNKKELVVRIPLLQDSYDAIGNKCGKISNIIGMIAGDEIGFAQVIDLGYKGSFDYGDFKVKYYGGDKIDFRKLCKELDIDIFEYPICKTCGKVIYGSYTMNDKGDCCNECEKK